MVTESALAVLKDALQLGRVVQDDEPPKSSSISQKSTKVLRPIKHVRFTKATQSHVNIREGKGPSFGTISPTNPCEHIVRTHQNSRIDFRKRRREKSDAPAEIRGDWLKVSLNLNKPFSHLPKCGVSQRHLKQHRGKENLL